MAMTAQQGPGDWEEMPPLTALRAFSVAARTGSFTIAARELRVSQGAVSRQIAHLEQFLQIRLFERQHREVRLTPEGVEFAASISAAFAQIAQGTLRLRRSRDNPSLRLKIFPTFAIQWLVPRLGDFHEKHPDIDVQITTSMQAAQLDREEIDFTVVSQPIANSDLIFDSLFEVELLPVCARSLLKDRPPITSPKDLIAHQLLHVETRSSDWKRWFEAVGLDCAVPRGGLRFGNSALVYQAAINGAGIAMAQRCFVLDDLATGRLVAPIQRSLATGEIYYLATRAAKSTSAAIAAFREWILAEALKREAMSGGAGNRVAGATKPRL